jgi:hypothetical protein
MAKKDQFSHNLAKHKRQAKAARELKSNTEQLRSLFADFGNIYTVTPGHGKK